MRELTSTELMLIAGGSGECEGDQDESVIVVCGEVPEPPYYPPPYNPPPSYPPPYSPPPTYGGGGGEPAPPCGASNEATITSVTGQEYSGLDGAKYYVPEGIDNNYINDAAAHIADIRLNGYPGQIYAEIYSMYTDTSNPHFLDFKEFGSSSMPGTPDAGTQTYWSTAAQEVVTTSWFEPYGNVIFGYMMTVAGYSPEETWAIAAAMQEGDQGGIFPSDDLQDQPHVQLGMAIAQQYMHYQNFSPIDIDSAACGA